MPVPLHGLGELEVSGDTSPPGGSRLDAPARPGGGRARSAGTLRPPSEPSMVKVVATTVRLWWRRRILRVADGARLGARRWSVLAIVVAVVAAGGIALGLSTGSRPAAPVKRVVVAKGPTPAQLEAEANEQAAGSWLAGQLAAGTEV